MKKITKEYNSHNSIILRTVKGLTIEQVVMLPLLRVVKLAISTSTLGPFFIAYHNLPESDCGCLVVIVWYTESFLMATSVYQSRDYHVYIPNTYIVLDTPC